MNTSTLIHRDYAPVPGSKIAVGVVSDTHRLVRPQALDAIAGVDLIVHAGDIGSADVLGAFEAIAPTLVIRGNIDRGAWAQALPDTASLRVAGVHLYLIHNLKDLDFDPATRGYQVVISGHSHAPRMRRDGGVLYLNPGSCGPRRFKLPIAVARMHIGAAGVDAELLTLSV